MWKINLTHINLSHKDILLGPGLQKIFIER